MTRKMWGLIPVLDCSQLMSFCPSQCKPSICPSTTPGLQPDSPQHTMTDEAFVTLATNDSYAKGAMVLGQSLRNHSTTRKLVILIGPSISEPCRDVLRSIFDEVLVVDIMDSEDTAHLALSKRPELGVTLTKLHCWTLTHYSKCVFMDADTLVLSNIDELFERDELSAAPDPGWPDCFNSGVFVFTPSNETHEKLLTFCAENGSFDGGDQGVLNSFFNTWATADISKHLPFIYNLSSVAIYSYLPAFRQYGKNAKVVHFLGNVKPWSHSHDVHTVEVKGQSLSGDLSQPHPDYWLMWWQLYSKSVLPSLQQAFGDTPCDSGFVEENVDVVSIHTSSEKDATRNGVSNQITIHQTPEVEVLILPIKLEEDVKEQLTSPSSGSPIVKVSSEERKLRWEAGQIDYMGDDSFENIERKLDSFLK
ncbi:glycogenin-1-like isoform X2 [Thalassophryne amazonica]|uniref:glycogenin-1-like isoform X2 n=1 Tax=Thalassophryne amazonica TaxID=390379 RepID=UPI001471D7C4|nr:glycogenin-1-like isoform X2 [Thalassophryne amazonica]